MSWFQACLTYHFTCTVHQPSNDLISSQIIYEQSRGPPGPRSLTTQDAYLIYIYLYIYKLEDVNLSTSEAYLY